MTRKGTSNKHASSQTKHYVNNNLKKCTNSNRYNATSVFVINISPNFRTSYQTESIRIGNSSSISYYTMILISLGIYSGVIMIIGTMIVGFTAPTGTEKICQRSFKSMIKYSSGNDSKPLALVVADLNNDQQPDIVVANHGTDSIDIFFGYDNGTFARQRTYSINSLSKPCAIAVADFNNDSWQDIAVTNYGTKSISIFIGVRHGNFTLPQHYSLGSSTPVAIIVADFNNDRQLDVAVANCDTSSIGILLGNGNGSFENYMTYSTGYDSLPNSLACHDLNNDNKIDIIVTNFGTHGIGIFWGYGNGSFEKQNFLSTGHGTAPSSVEIGDFNNDHYLDIAVANYGIGSIGILFGLGNRTFRKIFSFSVGIESQLSSMVVGHFNADSYLDMVVTDLKNHKIIVFQGLGNGTFISHESYFTGIRSSPTAVAVADFNNDNRLDIAVTNRRHGTIGIFLRYTFKPFTNQTIYSTGYPKGGVNSVVAADLNNDSVIDLICSTTLLNSIVVFFGNGDGTFRHYHTYSTGKGSYPQALAISDFNNDHIQDIVVINRDTTSIGILLGNGSGNFSDIQEYVAGSNTSIHSIAVGDLNNDKNVDVAVAERETDSVIVFFGYGNGTFRTKQSYLTKYGSTPTFVTIGDFNNDNCFDIAIALYDSNEVGILWGYGNESFTNMQAYSTGDGIRPRAIAIGDINNDNNMDIVFTKNWGHNVGILLGHGNGSFESVITYSTGDGSRPTSITLGDINHDTYLDIIVGNYATNNIGIFYGYGNGTFANQITHRTGDGSNPYSVAVAYFNDDHWLDVVVAHWRTQKISVLLGMDYTHSATETVYATGSGSHPFSLLVDDLDNDGQLDIVVVNAGIDNVEIRLGYGNGTFAPPLTYSLEINSHPQSVSVADLNNNHRMDMVVALTRSNSIAIFVDYTNEGFTSQEIHSTGYGSLPRHIAIGDFNNDSRLDFVIANEGSNSIGVFLNFDYVTFRNQTPSSTRPRSEPNAIVVGDYNKDNALDIAVVNRLTGSIGIHLGHGNGTFSSQIEYLTGFESLLDGLATGDFNRDGWIDFAVIHSDLNIVVTLFGYENGHLVVHNTYSTGNNSHPCSIVIGDFNNDTLMDIVVANRKAQNIGIFLGYENGSFDLQRTFLIDYQAYPNAIIVIDIDDNQRLDVLTCNSKANTISILYGDGEGVFQNITHYSIAPFSNPISIATADLNQNNQHDIVVVCYEYDKILILFDYCNKTFLSRRMYTIEASSFPKWISIADLNGDTYLDISVVLSGANSIGVFFGYGHGEFTDCMKVLIGEGSGPVAMSIADFNNDTLPDIAVVNSLAANTLVLTSSNRQLFLNEIIYTTGYNSCPHYVGVADLNNDGRLDIIVVNHGNNSIGIFLGYGDGNFWDQKTFSTGDNSRPHSVAIADFNDDGALDLIVANTGISNIALFFGLGDGTFAHTISYFTEDASVPFSMAISDFNLDRVLDIALLDIGKDVLMIFLGDGNGTVTKQKTYGLGYNAQPRSIAIGDFNNDNWMDVVVANYGTNGLHILLQAC